MADITNVKVGACSVNYNGVDVGHTIGGVEAVYTPEYHDIMVDRYGTSIAEKVLVGEQFTAKVVLAESTIANILVAIPNGTDNTGHMTGGSLIGNLASANAAQLVLHPLENEASDLSLDIVIYKAVSTDAVTFPLKNDGETAFEVTFTALIDESKSDGNYLFLIGDSTA